MAGSHGLPRFDPFVGGFTNSPWTGEILGLDDDRSGLIGAIRQIFSVTVPLSRDTALRSLADQAGYTQLEDRTREELEAVLRTAIRRKILEDGSEGLTLLARNITDYRRDVLKEQFIESMEGGGWVEREDSIRRFFSLDGVS